MCCLYARHNAVFIALSHCEKLRHTETMNKKADASQMARAKMCCRSILAHKRLQSSQCYLPQGSCHFTPRLTSGLTYRGY